MTTPRNYVDEVIAILRQVNTAKAATITAKTSVLSELDLDSLQMIELAEILKKEYGVDFFQAPRSLEDLASAESIAAVLQAEVANAP